MLYDFVGASEMELPHGFIHSDRDKRSSALRVKEV